MCGRYVNAIATNDLVDEFDVEETPDDDLPPSWNIAPTDPVRVVLERRPKGDDEAAATRQLRTVRWGLLPSWSKSRSAGAKMINARIETVTSKPAFKSAAARRRCLVPAQGYYEWQREGDGSKVPYFLHGDDGAMLAMAGLYELWRDPDASADDPNRWVWTCRIITQPATDVLGHIHDRCPLLVPPELWRPWLDCTSGDVDAAQQLLDSMPEPHLQPRRVSPAVGNVKNDGPELIRPVEPEPASQQLSLDV